MNVVSESMTTHVHHHFFYNRNDFSKNVVVVEGKGIYSGAIKDFNNDGDVDILGEDTYSTKSQSYYENLLLPIKKK